MSGPRHGDRHWVSCDIVPRLKCFWDLHRTTFVTFFSIYLYRLLAFLLVVAIAAAIGAGLRAIRARRRLKTLNKGAMDQRSLVSNISSNA